jgi:23S rRNA pseudoU1915 N3-methylase RlmH
MTCSTEKSCKSNEDNKELTVKKLQDFPEGTFKEYQKSIPAHWGNVYRAAVPTSDELNTEIKNELDQIIQENTGCKLIAATKGGSKIIGGAMDDDVGSWFKASESLLVLNMKKASEANTQDKIIKDFYEKFLKKVESELKKGLTEISKEKDKKQKKERKTKLLQKVQEKVEKALKAIRCSTKLSQNSKRELWNLAHFSPYHKTQSILQLITLADKPSKSVFFIEKAVPGDVADIQITKLKKNYPIKK